MPGREWIAESAGTGIRVRFADNAVMNEQVTGVIRMLRTDFDVIYCKRFTAYYERVGIPERMPFNYVCNQCGEGIIRPQRAKGRRGVYCSVACFRTAIAANGRRTCRGCGQDFNPSSKGQNPIRVYCTRACYEGSRKAQMATKTCTACGVAFTVKASIAHRYNVCSTACRTVDTIYVDCERCGTRFRAEKHLNRHFCSEECRRPPVTLACRHCGRVKRYTPAYATKRQFCSIACYRRFRGETGLEFRVREALERIGISFIQEHRVGRWSIDFALTDSLVAIEVDGSYWHAKTAERDRRRDAAIAQHGWRIIRLPDTDVNDAADLDGLIIRRLQEVAYA